MLHEPVGLGGFETGPSRVLAGADNKKGVAQAQARQERVSDFVRSAIGTNDPHAVELERAGPQIRNPLGQFSPCLDCLERVWPSAVANHVGGHGHVKISFDEFSSRSAPWRGPVNFTKYSHACRDASSPS